MRHRERQTPTRSRKGWKWQWRNFPKLSRPRSAVWQVRASARRDEDQEAVLHFQDEVDHATERIHAYAGWPAQILEAPCHPGERVRIEVTLTDLRMQVAHAEQTIRLATPDTPPPDACTPD